MRRCPVSAVGGVWGVAAVQGIADILVMLLAVPICVRILRDVKEREVHPPAEPVI